MTRRPAAHLLYGLAAAISLTFALPAPQAAAQSMSDESVRPIVNGGEFAAARSIDRETFGLINQRLAALRPNRVAPEPEGVRRTSAEGFSGELKTWWQFFGTAASQGSRNQVSGYDSASFGLAAGADKEISDNTVLGASFAWGDSTIDSLGAGNGKSEMDSYLLSVYGDYDTGHFYANGALTYGYNKVGTTKSWSGARRTGDYKANYYSARGEVGYAFMKAKTRLIPKLIGRYSYFGPGSYTESGAAAQNITYDAMSTVEVGAGLDINGLLANGEGSYWVPAMSLGYRYNIKDDPVVAQTQFVTGGQTYRIKGQSPSKSMFDFGLGLTYYSAAAWELLLDYNFSAGQDYIENAGSLRATYRFD